MITASTSGPEHMTPSRIQGGLFVSFGSAVLVAVLVFALTAPALDAVHDFIGSYYSAQCLLSHRDPYNSQTVLQMYQESRGPRDLENPVTREIITRYLYPPGAFAVVIPFALMPWSVAHILWAVLSACSLIFAAYLVWDLVGSNVPRLCGVLIGYVLASSYALVVLSNPSELAIGLCVAAVWCFLQNRFVSAGVVCLALSLAIKPQVAGLIWVYFLLAGGLARKRAQQTLAVAIVISAPFFVAVHNVAPSWRAELQTNLRALSVRGGAADPGPSSTNANDLIDLQVVASRIWDKPKFYDPVSYVTCLLLLVPWAAITIRTGYSRSSAIYALATIALLSMLPIYHHFYDAKLLLLTIPALGDLWCRGKRSAWIGLLLTSSCLIVTGDIFHRLLMQVALTPSSIPGAWGSWFPNVIVVCITPILLLITAAFFLSKYRNIAQSESTRSAPA